MSPLSRVRRLPLYNLEIIAYAPNNCPAGDFTGSNTHRIADRYSHPCPSPVSPGLGRGKETHPESACNRAKATDGRQL